MKKDTSNKKINKKKVKRLIIIILLIIILLFSYSIIKLIMHPTDTFMIEKGSIYIEESSVGYIIREETILQGENYKNGISQIKSEGERVAKGDPIFRYYSNNEEDLVEKIAELDQEIQDALEEQSDVFSGDIKLLDNQIEEKITQIRGVNDLNTINEYKKEINEYMLKKAKIVGELSPSGSYLKKLIDQRSSYEEQLNSGSEYVNATTSGIVSYKIDGLETILTPDKFDNLSKDFLDKLKLKTGQIIATNNESAKIVNNFNCYIAVVLNSDEAKKASIDDSVKLRILNSDEIDAKVEYIAKPNDNEIIIVFKIDEYIKELIDYRKISIDIIWSSSTGLKVPNSAIIEENEIQYVVRNRAGYTDKIMVKILKQNENYSIIENYTTDELKELGYEAQELYSRKIIALYDEILLNPTS